MCGRNSLSVFTPKTKILQQVIIQATAPRNFFLPKPSTKNAPLCQTNNQAPLNLTPDT